MIAVATRQQWPATRRRRCLRWRVLPVPRVEEAPATSEICGAERRHRRPGCRRRRGRDRGCGRCRRLPHRCRGELRSLRLTPGPGAHVGRHQQEAGRFRPMDFRPPQSSSCRTGSAAFRRQLPPPGCGIRSHGTGGCRPRGRCGGDGDGERLPLVSPPSARRMADRSRTGGSRQAGLVSARPGYSEHQSGMAADLVACGAACGTLDHSRGLLRVRGSRRTRGSTAGSSATRTAAPQPPGIWPSPGTCASSACPWRPRITSARGTVSRSSSASTLRPHTPAD